MSEDCVHNTTENIFSQRRRYVSEFIEIHGDYLGIEKVDNGYDNAILRIGTCLDDNIRKHFTNSINDFRYSMAAHFLRSITLEDNCKGKCFVHGKYVL